MEKVVVILGPTAVGKSALGIKVSKALGGEIISADATQIYRGLDKGSAKIRPDEMQGVPHHMIDIKNFDEKFNAFMFVEEAKRLIDEILDRGNVPVIVGGTNLYVSALVRGYDFEKAGKSDEPYEMRHKVEYALFALNFDERAELYARINVRVDKMIDEGLEEEVRVLKKAGLDKDSQAGKGIGYREMLMYLAGEMTREEAILKIKQHSRNFAKRQLTWLRSMPEVVWLDAKVDNLEAVLRQIGKV